MQTLVDLTDDQVADLKALAQALHTSPDDLMREAISDYLKRRRRELNRSGLEAAFGLWRNEEDGVAYQQRLRDEW